ncbi:hypothetical protein KFL_000030460 [Klebsormidium nitens]|uniref:Uncharacterized protein n=1 Tax=Klebsormidium nitens TaxID=105231 RepID=A0A1Y1HKV9_KLENI|nr:hypothetical protein KFL_000030460 [Klebsormidium nitens]|eukprot:GAQ77769.1 hypothetical protein KFL_000030460 [Klebsormidium nitens]
MIQLARARILVHFRTAVQGLPKYGGTYVRCVASGKESRSLQEGTVDEKRRSSAIDDFGQKRMGFFEAADVLSKPPVKPKRLGFDFHLWMFIVALAPSAIIYVSAQLIRRVIRQKEKELQEQEKAELQAKLDALYSSNGPNKAANGLNLAADGSNQAVDGPDRISDGSKQVADGSEQSKSVRSRSQRHVAERADRKLERARAYLDESQIAALERLSEKRGALSSRDGERQPGEAKNERGEKVVRVAESGPSSEVGPSRQVTEKRGPESAEERTGKEAGSTQAVRKEGLDGSGNGGASQAELVWLRAKVAELERGLKGLEDSVRQREGEGGRIVPGAALDGTRDGREIAASSRNENDCKAGPEESLGQRGLAEGNIKHAGQTKGSADNVDVNVPIRKPSLFDNVWPQWLRSTAKRDEAKSQSDTTVPSVLKKDEGPP